MSVNIGETDGAVAAEVANAAPIIDLAAPTLTPTLNYEPVPGLPKELQPDPGDILLGKAFWPWEDLGARGIPESWLYMSRKVQGTVAMLAVQTSAGPKLVKANSDGSIAASFPQPVTMATIDLSALASGGSQDIVVPPKTKAIFVYSYSIDVGEAGSGPLAIVFSLGDAAGVYFIVLGGSNALRHWDLAFPAPVSLPRGVSLTMFNQDTIAHTFIGTVAYALQ